MNTFDEMMQVLREKIPNPMWESAVAREAVRFLCERIDAIEKRIPPAPPVGVPLAVDDGPSGEEG